MVISEALGGDERAVRSDDLQCHADSAGDIELLRIDLRGSDEHHAREVDLLVIERLQDKRLPPVMAGHLLRRRPDTGQCVDAAVQKLERRYDDRDISEVYVRARPQDADRLDREEEVVMHRSLSHDLLYDDDLLLSGVPVLLKGLRPDDETLICLLQGLADLLGDDIRRAVRCQGARALHIHLRLDRDIGLDEDVSLVRRTGAAPHDILIEEALGGTELTDLNAVLIRPGYDHDDIVEDSGHAASELILSLLHRDRLHIHDRIGEGMVLIGGDDVDLQIQHDILGVDRFLLNSLADREDRALQLRLRASPDLCDLKMLSREAPDEDILLLLGCLGLRQRGKSLSGSRRAPSCGGSRCRSDPHRDLNVDPLPLSDMNLQCAACCQGSAPLYRRGRCCRLCRSGGLRLLLLLCKALRRSLHEIRGERRQGITGL